MEDNFSKAMQKTQEVAKNCCYRYFTVFGQICVIKMLMLPKLAHIATILPRPSITRNKVAEVDNICLKFLRTNKRAIDNSSKTLYATKAQDGLCITRISEFWTALKISWLRRFCSSNSFWTILKREWLRDHGHVDLDPRCTDWNAVELICKKRSRIPFGKMYIKISTSAYGIFLKCIQKNLYISPYVIKNKLCVT